jgi:hypothetical protein
MTDLKKQALLRLQQHLVEISQELDQVRASSPKDASIINLNIGRLQGLSEGLGWMMQDGETKPPSVGFNFKEFGTLAPEEEEYEEGDEDEA